MSTGYLLQDIPNEILDQYGWPRYPLGYNGPKLSGVIGVHTTEGPTLFQGPDFSADNVLNFLRTRNNHGSYHVMSDYDSIFELIHHSWSAWADTTNNAHAMSVSGSLQANRWLELTKERRDRIVKNMAIGAAIMVKKAVKEGYLSSPTPARRITPEEAITGSRAGFYGHGETNPGTRYDPGHHFDWALFLNTYSDEVFGKKGMFTVSEFAILKALGERAVAIASQNQREIRDLPEKILNYKFPEAHTGGETTLATKGQYEKVEHVKTQKKVDAVLKAVKAKPVSDKPEETVPEDGK